jgi:hypothetical protein
MVTEGGSEIHKSKKKNIQWSTLLVSVLCETEWKTDRTKAH